MVGLTLGGCGVSPIPSIEEIVEPAQLESSDTIVFADDADPATASLPSVDGELLVQPYPGADASALVALYAEVGATVTAKLDDIDLTVLQVPPDELAQIAAALGSSGLLEGVHKNYIFQNQQSASDPMFLLQHHLPEIEIAKAWEYTVGSQEIAVAIVDTGVQADHPDLADRIVEGWNVVESNRDYFDVAGHGTKVAGVVGAASNNGIGVTGITWDSPLLAVRVTDDNGAATSQHIAAGILWAVSRGAKVINVSFAPLWSNSIVRAAARNAFHRGSLVVISAGNGGGVTRSRGYSEALFVGAVDEFQEHALFSDRGPFVDIAAPGTAIRTTALGSGYSRPDGTSFAAPIVAGVAALAWSVNPDLRPSTIVNALTGTANDLGPDAKADWYGNGLVNPGAAVQTAAETVFLADETPPTLQIVSPEEGETLGGRSVVTVVASDRWGIADVVMSVDGVAFATDTRIPYRFVVSADTVGAGDHEFSWVATDVAGNASEPVFVTVNVVGSALGDAPEITFNSPRAGTLVSGDVTITATVSSSASLVSVEWLVDGVSEFVAATGGTSSRVTYIWRSDDVAPGSHTLTLVVTDAAGRFTTGRLELVAR